MATKGLSYFVAGKYTYSQGAVTYTDGRVLAKAVSYTVSLDEPTRNDFYADNAVAESDNQVFNGGNISLDPAQISPENKAWLLGQTARSVTVGTNTTVDVYDYDDNMEPPYVGFGMIEMLQVDNVDKFQAIILVRAKTRIPANTATTKGETINWQTHPITADIYRDETTAHRWMSESEYFDSEADAKAYLNSIFGISA